MNLDIIYDIYIKIQAGSWIKYINEFDEVKANQIAMILSGNSNVTGVKIAKIHRVIIDEQIISDSSYMVADHDPNS